MIEPLGRGLSSVDNIIAEQRAQMARFLAEHEAVEQNLKYNKMLHDKQRKDEEDARNKLPLPPPRITIKELFDAMPPDVQRKISCYDLKRIVDNLNP